MAKWVHSSAGQSHNFERKVLVTGEYHRVESKGSRSSIIGHLLKHPIVKFRICELPRLVLLSCISVRTSSIYFFDSRSLYTFSDSITRYAAHGSYYDKQACRRLYTMNVITEKEVVWLGDIFWKGSMEFSSHRDFYYTKRFGS